MKEYLPYRVGKMYYYGLGTEQNFEKAYEMFETSGSIFSKYMLGKMAYAGQGMERNYELAYQYFSECANQNAYAAYQAASDCRQSGARTVVLAPFFSVCSNCSPKMIKKSILSSLSYRFFEASLLVFLDSCRQR